MGDGEGGDDFGDFFESPCDKNQGEDEEDVVETGEEVLDPEAEEAAEGLGFGFVGFFGWQGVRFGRPRERLSFLCARVGGGLGGRIRLRRLH